MYDLASAFGGDWTPIEEALRANPMISNTYLKPFHKKGRGAGGSCFIKDFAALRMSYEKNMRADKPGMLVLRALEAKNKELLIRTGKDLHLLEGVYGSALRPSKKKVKSS